MSVHDRASTSPDRAPSAQSQGGSSPQTFGVTLSSRPKAVSEPVVPPADPSSPDGAESQPASGASVFGVTLGAKAAPRRSTVAVDDSTAVRVCCRFVVLFRLAAAAVCRCVQVTDYVCRKVWRARRRQPSQLPKKYVSFAKKLYTPW